MAIKILHLSDFHLFADPHAKFVNIIPYQSLATIVAEINARSIPPELVVMTGDYSQDHTEESYQLVSKIIRQIKCPISSTLGNHDSPKLWQEMTKHKPFDKNKNTLLTNWQIIILNSHWPEHVEGVLSKEELEFLEDSLIKQPEKPAIVFLHHHPFNTTCQWINRIGLSNAEDFWAIVLRHPQIKAIFCGHVHQENYLLYEGIPCYSTPSTCWQFAPMQEHFRFDQIMPGYRWIELGENGDLTTGVIRLPYNPEFIPDLETKGY
jgi:3',5'-cyclic-AMP phosphodiesterase